MSHSTPYRHGSNLCSSSCPIEHIDVRSKKIKKPANSWPDIRGLNGLNYSRDAWVNGDAIEVSIATYCRGLPHALQEKIGLGAPGLHSNFWRRATSEEDMEALVKSRTKRALNQIRTTEYSIFPVCIDQIHWVLVIIRKAQRPNCEDTELMEWSHVEQIAVLEPFHKPEVMTMVCDRLARWLQEAGGFTVAPAFKQAIWVPHQNDSTSCGPRAYWHAKQIFDRLLDLYERDMSYHPSLWDDLSGWFNEDFVRSEMIGRCAAAAVHEMDYKARIAVEYVNRVRDISVTEEEWQDAAKIMRPPSYKNRRPQRRPRPRTLWQPPSDAITQPVSNVDILQEVQTIPDFNPIQAPNQTPAIPELYPTQQGTMRLDNHKSPYINPVMEPSLVQNLDQTPMNLYCPPANQNTLSVDNQTSPDSSFAMGYSAVQTMNQPPIQPDSCSTKSHDATVDNHDRPSRGTKRRSRSRSPDPIRIPPAMRTPNANSSPPASTGQSPGSTTVSQGQQPDGTESFDTMWTDDMMTTGPIDWDFILGEGQNEIPFEQFGLPNQQEQEQPLPQERMTTSQASPVGLFTNGWQGQGQNPLPGAGCPTPIPTPTFGSFPQGPNQPGNNCLPAVALTPSQLVSPYGMPLTPTPTIINGIPNQAPDLWTYNPLHAAGMVGPTQPQLMPPIPAYGMPVPAPNPIAYNYQNTGGILGPTQPAPAQNMPPTPTPVMMNQPTYPHPSAPTTNASQPVSVYSTPAAAAAPTTNETSAPSPKPSASDRLNPPTPPPKRRSRRSLGLARIGDPR